MADRETIPLPPSRGARRNRYHVSDWADQRIAAAQVAFEKNERHLPEARSYQWIDPYRIDPRDWLYGHTILRKTVRARLSPGGTGKTSLQVVEALAIVTGKPLLGVPVYGGPTPVWLWNLEEPADEMQRRIQAACLHYGLTPSDLAGRLHVNCGLEGDPLRLAWVGEKGIEFDEALTGWIMGELIEKEIGYLDIDPFVSSHGVDENSNPEIDAIAKRYAMMAKHSGAAIGLTHHTSKSGSAEVTTHSSRGAVALTDACRSVTVLNRMSAEEAERFGIEAEARRRYFRTYDDKANMAVAAEHATWFHIASVSLGNAMDEAPADSVGVVERWVPPEAFEGVSVDHLYRVQLAIAEGAWKAHHTAEDWAGKAVARVMGLDCMNKGDKTRIKTMLATWTANGALTVVDGKDINRQWKKYLVVGQWANDQSATPRETVA